RLIHEQSIALVVIQGHHLVSEVGDDDAWTSGMVIISGIYSHSGARNAIFTESDPRLHAFFSECAIAVVHEELVGLCIVGQQQIWPAIIVVIENRDAKRFGSSIVEAGFFGYIFELAIAKVVP